MTNNRDFSPPVPLTTTGDPAADETVRAVLKRRGNLVHLRVEDAAGYTTQISLSLSTMLAKFPRHVGEVILTQVSIGSSFQPDSDAPPSSRRCDR